MKKVLIPLMVAAALIMTVTACGGKSKSTGGSESGGSVVVTPIPYPVNPSPLDSSAKIKRYALDQVIEYRSLPKYSEPDYVTAQVNQGKLPPVNQRLPETPQVIKTSFMADGPGPYGGVFANVFAVPIEGWNFGAGAVNGWFGIEAIVSQCLLSSGPAYLRSDANEPFPALATGWTWSSDGLTLTMDLIKGAKWSDGQPFTADDVMYTWEDNINDPNVAGRSSPGTWAVGGKPTKLEKVNDYQIKWTFAEPFPVYLLWAMADDRFYVAPAHYYKPHHPKYNSNATYSSFRSAGKPTALPVPVLGPWVPTEYRTDELLVFKRNPYYWKVDSDGRQLPYIDEVHFTYATNSLARTMNTMAGTCDLSNVGESYDDVARSAADPNAPFRVDWQGDSHAYGMEFNYDTKFGVSTDQDKANRALFRDIRFRQALTMALDRDGIAASLAAGPFYRAWGGGLLPASPLYTRESVVYLPYNVETAKAILASLGLKTNSEGYLGYPEGPLAGKTIEIQLLAQQDLGNEIDIAQAAIPMFQAIGIKLTMKVLTGTAISETELNGKWDMKSYRYDSPQLVPNAFPAQLSPTDDNMMYNHYKIKTSGDAMPFETELNRITTAFATETDAAKQRQLMAEYNKVWTENATNIGVVTVSYGQLLNKYMKNVQPGLPVNLYSWGHQSMFMEQLYFEPDHQRRLILGTNLPLNYPAAN
ncbi:periplasmic alpha-galactoside-binding protein [Leadbettera azotonutricia ZAS-9]|uniref:Periplasmic alpha-galactoside-binding protein n=2 Tax=Leadbettera azotonutricia TaxID=150829 RepID=F5Y7E9_LEAAZ|nr:periplasmic alpha-galactoside-binding protein [Leadbettera azotonutricia ZAS-9]